MLVMRKYWHAKMLTRILEMSWERFSASEGLQAVAVRAFPSGFVKHL